MALRVRRDETPPREDGFTLVEMVVTVTIIAVLFVSVSVMLDSGLRAMAASKARARGNDVATQGIEDLQRYGFNTLGLCSAPSGTAPSGLETTVLLTNCTGSTNLEEPCNDPVGAVPDEEYTCVRNNVSYTVKRYVAWVDALRTTKRLAVFVEWTDLVGNHQVSQQSSLRAPDQSAITGLAPPTFSSTQPPTATGSTNPVVLTGSNTLSPGSSVTFTAKTANLNARADTTLHSSGAILAHAANDVLDITVTNGSSFPSYNGFPVTIDSEAFTVIAGAGSNNWRVVATGTASHSGNAPVTFAGDRVYATMLTIGANASPESHAVLLNSTNGTDWTATLDSTSTLEFGAGSQYVSFGILRASDGKSTSAFATPALAFCPCTGVNLPTVTITQAPSNVALDDSGGLEADAVVKVRTTNVTSADTVTVNFLTQAGSVGVVLTQDRNPDGSATCPGSDTATPGVVCLWTGTIAKSAGYRFASGTQKFYFGAAQVLDTVNPATIDKGSTGAAISGDVTFG